MGETLDRDPGPEGTDLANPVRVLAVWILCGGFRFFQDLVLYHGAEDESLKGAYQGGELYKGPVFGRQRWNFSQRELAAKAEDLVDEECRELGWKAADYMAALARMSHSSSSAHSLIHYDKAGASRYSVLLSLVLVVNGPLNIGISKFIVLYLATGPSKMQILNFLSTTLAF
jgi:hypothetical protein